MVAQMALCAVVLALAQQEQCGCYANFTASALVLDSYPTGNGCPGACLTSSALSIQGETSHDDKREYLVSLGLTSSKGTVLTAGPHLITTKSPSTLGSSARLEPAISGRSIVRQAGQPV